MVSQFHLANEKHSIGVRMSHSAGKKKNVRSNYSYLAFQSSFLCSEVSVKTTTDAFNEFT